MTLERKTTKKTTKKAASKKPIKATLTPAQQVAALLAKEKPTAKKPKIDGNVIFDPDAPLATADTWVQMPHPWQELTGVKGIPFGHVTTIQGKQDSGKTTIAMHGMVESQNQGFNVVLIDTEHKFNMKRFANMGGDVTNVLQIKAMCLEEGFDAIDRLIPHYQKITPGVPVFFLWDSLGMTPTEEEMNGDARKITVASAAKVIKKNIRRQVAKFKQTNNAMVFINHLYDNINAMFGNSTKGYGGNGAYFASVLVLEVQRIGQWYNQKGGKKNVLGLKAAIKCTKNHLSAVQGNAVQVKIGSDGLDQGSVAPINEDGEVESFADGDDMELPDFGGANGAARETAL